MKKFFKKSLKWFGVGLILIIIALIAIPLFFKNELKEMVLDEVNTNLNAELKLEDFDLTFISTFPNLTVKLWGVELNGKDEFKDVQLAKVKLVQAHVDFWSVVSGDQIEIDEIHVENPSIDVRVLQSGLANYDIVKSDEEKTPEEIEEPSNFKLSLKEYSISDGQISYADNAGNMSAVITNLNHTGSGDLTADKIDFKTTTNMDKLSYTMDGISYLTDVKTDALVNLLMEFNESSSKFTLQENKISLNEITFSINGFYEMLENHDNIDLSLDASQATFKEFLSLIPAFYHSGYEGMVSSGKLALNGLVKGKLDEKNLPGWDVDLSVKDASINYPDLPGKITNIQMKGGSSFPGGENLDLMTIDVPKFHANLSKNTIDLSLQMKQLMSDPFIASSILANLDLSTLKDFMPMAEGESYQGILDADVDIKGKMSDLENSNFEAFTAEGDLILSEMKYNSPDIPHEVDIQKMKFTFSPQNLALNEMNTQMGKSDFAMKGKVDNYFGYLLRDEVLTGDFTMHSNHLDLEELVPESEESSEPEETVTTSTGDEPILVPANIDFLLVSTIDDTRYNGIDIKNMKGNIRLKDEVATLENMTMNTMGGEVGLKGSYNTQDHAQPKMNFGYTLKEINIHDLATNFITVDKLMPIAKYANGKISSNLDMTSSLTPSFEPILTSLTSIGDIRSNTLSVTGLKSLEKLEGITKLQSLSNISSQSIKDFATNFKVEDGKVHVSPFDVMLGKIGTEISGFTTLDQKMDYSLKMNVPKEEIPQSMIQEVEKAMSKLNAMVPKLNIGALPNFIPVNVKMVGDITNPKITTDFKEAILKATGDFKDNLINSVTETVKDSVSNVVNEQVDNAKEELEKEKQKILDDAQREADKVVAEAKKAADLVREEGDKQAEELIKNAGSNPIKKRIAQEGAKTIRAQAEKNALKLEQEGQKQADNIMAKAREQADGVGK